MSSLESRIDDLYRGPLDEFIAARSALASELNGADQQRVKHLKKPTAVPWAVNQVYWHARAVFDRAHQSGVELRRVQIAALKGKSGRSADLPSAAEAHRHAVAAAVAQAVRFADASHMHPDRDALARTFEALTLAPTPPEPPGRLTQLLQPGGFEMLAGVPLNAGLKPRATSAVAQAMAPSAVAQAFRPADEKQKAREQRAAIAAARARERELAEAARHRATATKKAEGDLARARDQEAQVARAWERAKEHLEKAKRALSELG